MITMAEAMSAGICECCGRPVTILASGEPSLTRCEEHASAGAVVAPEQRL